MRTVTHEMGFAAAIANEVVFLADGTGPPSHTLRNPWEDRIQQFRTRVLA